MKQRNASMLRRHHTLFLGLLFLFGFLFRLYLLKVFPQPFVYDQLQYHEYAQGILNFHLFAHSFRLYGYPLFVALTYLLGGEKQIIGVPMWQLAQALLDTGTGLLLFFIAKKVFSNFRIPLGVYLLYLFNPFTSAYTGVLLAEVLSTFLVAFIFLLILHFIEKKSVWYAMIISLVLGFLVAVRPSFIILSIVLVLWLLWETCRKFVRKKILYGLVILLSFFLPFVYTIVGNWAYFDEFSLLDVDNYSLLNLYVSLYVEKSSVNLTSIWEYPKEVMWAYNVYPQHERTPSERHLIQKQFYGYVIEKIVNNPLQFLWWRVEKMFFVWEKPTIFPYDTNPNSLLSKIGNWMNIGLLVLAVVGMYLYRKTKKIFTFPQKIFFRLSGFLFIYTSLIHTLTECLPRYSLPAYPYVLLFSILGMSFVFRIVKYILGFANHG